jgi:hypothetical protein
VREGADQRSDSLRVVRERQAGDGRQAHVGVPVVEHPLQRPHAAGQPEVGEQEHGPAARRGAA